MFNILIIADDITGAAEVAGAAAARGHHVRLVCGADSASLSLETTDHGHSIITVIATDMRSMTADEAIAETRRIAALLDHFRERIIIKTDSALRGHVVPILTTLMHSLDYQRAVYLPANPSKGRIIRDGTYYVEGTPIHQTAFSYDPEFPAHTSCMKERFPEAQDSGIIMPDAESREDIIRVIENYDNPQTLFAGAADLIDALLTPQFSKLNAQSSKLNAQSSKLNAQSSKPLTPALSQGEGAPARPILHSSLFTLHSSLLLCGSTQSKPPHIGIPITEMPLSVYNGSTDLEEWKREAGDLYQKEGSLIITIPSPLNSQSLMLKVQSLMLKAQSPSPQPSLAHHLREMTAALIHHLVAIRMPQQLILEGGASAFAALRHLGWSKLEVISLMAPGVVLTKAPNGTFVIMKPGSYPWGKALSFKH